ncbi:MAG TPA: NepR family anti-sigma factor [Sphingomicrobium sp.]|nr:NepR family anti-sigma factor [Sphingomicrobium sp.]
MMPTPGDENESAHPDERDKSLSAISNAELKRDDRGSPAPKEMVKAPRRKRSADAPDDVSRALRTAYDDTLREDVPDDFLDLLGKLS